jgi:hypothetical protein
MLLSLCGCFSFTRGVWTYGNIRTLLGDVQEVRVSENDDVCIIYEARPFRAEPVTGLRDWEFFYFGIPHPQDLEESWPRAVIFSGEDIRRLANDGAGSPMTVLPETAVQAALLPTRAPVESFDREDVHRRTAGWRTLDVHVELLYTEFKRRYEYRVAQGAYVGPDGREYTPEQVEEMYSARRSKGVERARDRGEAVCLLGGGPPKKRMVEVPLSNGRRIRVPLVERQGTPVWLYPTRVLLTAPALALDVVKTPLDLVVVPIVLYQLPGQMH